MANYRGKSYSRTRAKGRASAAKSRNRGIALKVITVAALLFVIVGALAVFWWLSDGVWGTLPTFTVKTDGHKYGTNKTDVKLYPGTEFEIDSFFGKKYTLKIEANADTTDFALTVDGEEKKWSDFEGQDFTGAFTVGRFKNKYTVNYTNLKEVCEAKTSGTVEIADDVQGDIFDVVITCGKREVRLSCYVAPTVKLNPDEIEFDKPGTEQTPEAGETPDEGGEKVPEANIEGNEEGGENGEQV